MNYKQKNVPPPYWTHDPSGIFKEPEPYDQITIGQACEMTTTDGEMVLLAIQSHLDESTGLVTLYAIEAPRSCPVRRDFEWGQITWTEFWNRKPWLLEITYRLGFGDASSRYITPSDISEETQTRFDNLGHRGPYILKYQALKRLTTVASLAGWDVDEAERNYRNFVTRHAKKLKERLPEEFADDASTNLMDDCPKKFTA